jgi:hypothetical protein
VPVISGDKCNGSLGYDPAPKIMRHNAPGGPICSVAHAIWQAGWLSRPAKQSRCRSAPLVSRPVRSRFAASGGILTDRSSAACSFRWYRCCLAGQLGAELTRQESTVALTTRLSFRCTSRLSIELCYSNDSPRNGVRHSPLHRACDAVFVPQMRTVVKVLKEQRAVLREWNFLSWNTQAPDFGTAA